MAIYDRTFKVPAWVILDLGEKRAQVIIDALQAEAEVYHQAWPGKTFIDTVKDLGKKGWNHVVGQKMPFNADVQFVTVALSKHIKISFTEMTMLQGTQDKPYQHALNRRIESDKDWERVFNDALKLENDIALCQIFGLAAPRAPVYITVGASNRDLISRLASKTLTVSETDGSINVKGKKNDEICNLIVTELEKLLNQ